MFRRPSETKSDHRNRIIWSLGMMQPANTTSKNTEDPQDPLSISPCSDHTPRSITIDTTIESNFREVYNNSKGERERSILHGLQSLYQMEIQTKKFSLAREGNKQLDEAMGAHRSPKLSKIILQ